MKAFERCPDRCRAARDVNGGALAVKRTGSGWSRNG
jgi:hypothetical protein